MVLTLPLDGSYASKLAMFMLTMEDRCFDDVIDNIVNPGSPNEDWDE